MATRSLKILRKCAVRHLWKHVELYSFWSIWAAETLMLQALEQYIKPMIYNFLGGNFTGRTYGKMLSGRIDALIHKPRLNCIFEDVNLCCIVVWKNVSDFTRVDTRSVFPLCTCFCDSDMWHLHLSYLSIVYWKLHWQYQGEKYVYSFRKFKICHEDINLGDIQLN